MFVEGRAVGNLPLSNAVTVNEGTVDIEVRAEGYRRAFEKVLVAGRSYQRIVLRLEKDALVSRSDLAPAPPALALDTRAAGPSSASSTGGRSLWTWVFAGTALLALGITALLLANRSEDPAFDHERTIP